MQEDSGRVVIFLSQPLSVLGIKIRTVRHSYYYAVLFNNTYKLDKQKFLKVAKLTVSYLIVVKKTKKLI